MGLRRRDESAMHKLLRLYQGGNGVRHFVVTDSDGTEFDFWVLNHIEVNNGENPGVVLGVKVNGPSSLVNDIKARDMKTLMHGATLEHALARLWQVRTPDGDYFTFWRQFFQDHTRYVHPQGVRKA